MKEKIYFETLSFIHQLSTVSNVKGIDDSNKSDLTLEERLLKINQLSIDCITALNFLQTIRFNFV